MTESAIDTNNRRAYSSRTALKFYGHQSALFPAERAILEKLRPQIAGKRLLDIGIGAGRTTPYLLEISHTYVGIDYSPRLIECARTKFGIDTLYQCDARDMQLLADGSFDFALFSFNGLDCLSHEGRLKALREIRRVLRTGGLLVFSSHNREWRYTGKPPWSMMRAEQWTRASLKAFIWACALQLRHRRMRRLEVNETEYAILNDIGLRYRCLIYFISIRAQIEQLRQLGFGPVDSYDMEGRRVESDDESPWIYYVTRKSALPIADHGRQCANATAD